MVTPVMSRSAATRCISYHTVGNSICRCGSLASIGRPPLVLLAASTQLLLLPRRAVGDSHSRPLGYTARTGGTELGAPPSLDAITPEAAVVVLVVVAGATLGAPSRIAGPSAG